MKRVWSKFLLVLAMPYAAAFAQFATPPSNPGPDPGEEREPAIIVTQSASGIDQVITSWIRTTTYSAGQLQVAAIDASSLGISGWTQGSLPCPFATPCSNHPDDTSGDPMLAENPYPNQSNQKYVYLIGASRRPFYNNDNQISVWSTTNGGLSWNNFAALDYQSDGTWIADKPSIAVSRAPATRGWVYTAHVRAIERQTCADHPGVDYNKIIVTRVDGTPQVLQTIDTGSPCASSPIIVLDPVNAGWMHVVWLDWKTNKIKVASSSDGFANYTYPFPELDAGKLFGPGNDVIFNDPGAGIIGVRSMLMARFNAISGTVGITWHARETTNLNSSDVKFVEYTPYTRSFGTVWTVTDSQSISTPGAPTIGAQWNPALDYDSNGDYLVSYYDTRGLTQSSSAFNYNVKAARIMSGGMRTGVPDLLLTTAPSNLYQHSAGEYMDLWNWNGRVYSAFIQVAAQNSDPAVVAVFPRQKTPVDFDGDHVSDVVMYRHGTWICYNQNNGAQLWSVTTDNFTDSIPLPMDYDGDGRSNFTLFRPGIGWYFYNANGSLYKMLPITLAGAQPAPADYDGNGTDDVVVYQKQTGIWTKYDFNTGAVAWSVTTDNFGVADGIPVPMDYDGDGRAEFTVFRPGLNWHFYNEDGSHYSGVWIGLPNAVPAPGDYDGDGKEDMVVFDRDNPSFLFYNIKPAQYVRSVITPGGSANGDPIQPAPLDYDGDGSVDLTYMNGGPWDFWLDNGTLRNAFWTGGNTGDLAMSRRQQPKHTP